MTFTYEEHIRKIENGNVADSIDDYFYIKSTRSNSPSNNRFEDIAYNLLTKIKSKFSPSTSPNNSPKTSPISHKF